MFGNPIARHWLRPSNEMQWCTVFLCFLPRWVMYHKKLVSAAAEVEEEEQVAKVVVRKQLVPL